jgi:hypothetical protein
VGDALQFSGAECGQFGDKWEPGTILKNGKFSTFASQIRSISAQITRARNNTVKNQLISKRKSLTKKLKRDAPICKVFEAGVARPARGVTSQADAVVIPWGANVVSSSFVIGSTYKFFCPANGIRTSIWGTDTYTADSSICGAAVHAGMIAAENGGNVTLIVLGAQPGFNGSLRNSVSTNFFNSFAKSFAFLNPTSGLVVSSSAPLVAPWNFSLTSFRANVNVSYSFLCPANGTLGSVWGTGIYTDDSSLCTAAVHAGKASLRKGGLVSAKISAGLSDYRGTRKNGVTSRDFGTWGGSYSFN